MQDEVNEKCVTIIVNGGKISEQILKDAIMLAFEHMKTNLTRDGAEATYKGRVKVVDLAAKGEELANIEITDKNIRSFERFARKYNVTYSLKKDRSREPPRYLVFFKARDSVQMEAAFKEYTGYSLKKKSRSSILESMRKLMKEQTRHREREKTKEHQRSEAR